MLSEQPQQGGCRAVSDRTGRDRMAASLMTGEEGGHGQSSTVTGEGGQPPEDRQGYLRPRRHRGGVGTANGLAAWPPRTQVQGDRNQAAAKEWPH